MAKRKPRMPSPGRHQGQSGRHGHQRHPGRPDAAARAWALDPSRSAGGERYWLYGWHAARAALSNPKRLVLSARATPEATKRLAAELADTLASRGIVLETANRGELEAVLPPGAVHQGLALEVRPLAAPALATWLDDAGHEEATQDGATQDGADTDAAGRPVLLALDQVSDPHNVGAVLRSAAAFGARAVIAPRHGQAPETGALAKAASGALDVIPYIDAGNLARALDLLKARGFWVLGLAGEAADDLAAADPGGPLVLVLGGEGTGLRRLTREACDLLARLPTRPPIGQLNVSNAAAVALYEVLGRRA